MKPELWPLHKSVYQEGFGNGPQGRELLLIRGSIPRHTISFWGFFCSNKGAAMMLWNKLETNIAVLVCCTSTYRSLTAESTRRRVFRQHSMCSTDHQSDRILFRLIFGRFGGQQ